MIDKIRERLQKGIYSFEERLKYDTKTQRHLLSQNNGINYAINIINEVKAEYNNGWIPCSERLPERRCELLVIYVDVNNVVRAGLTMYEPKRKQFWVSPSVTHWQPLPQLPKGECWKNEDE